MKTLLFCAALLSPYSPQTPQAFDVAPVKVAPRPTPIPPLARASFKTDPGRLAASEMTLSELIQPNLQSVAAAHPVPASDEEPGITTRVDRSKGTVDSIGVVGKNVRLADIAAYLSGRMNRMVVDKTGIEGVFNFDQEVKIDREEIADKDVPERDAVAHIFADFVKAVGLKLESQRAPVEMLVVDHAEKPDQN